MATGAYVGAKEAVEQAPVENKKIKEIWLGVKRNNVLENKKVIKGYVGVRNREGQVNVKLWWNPQTISGYVIFENGVWNYVPDGLDINLNTAESNVSVTELVPNYGSNKTLWIHNISIVVAWDVINNCIDSQYDDYDHQDVMNIIYIPINRIQNPEKLLITARGNLKANVASVSSGIMTEYSLPQVICMDRFIQYEIDINMCNHIDYIVLKSPDIGTILPGNHGGKTISESRITHFSTPIYMMPNQIVVNYDSDYILPYDEPYHVEFNVTEGWAYGFVFTSEEEDERTYCIGFYSAEPFEVRRNPYKPGGRYIATRRSYTGVYSCFIQYSSLPSGDYYYKDENYNIIARFNVDFTVYHRVNSDYILDQFRVDTPDPPEGYGGPYIIPSSMDNACFLAKELEVVVYDSNELTVPEEQVLLPLQQVSRIEVVGGEIVPFTVLEYWEYPITWATDYLEYDNGNLFDRVYIPENCFGLIVKLEYIPNQYHYFHYIIGENQFSAYAFTNIPSANKETFNEMTKDEQISAYRSHYTDLSNRIGTFTTYLGNTYWLYTEGDTSWLINENPPINITPSVLLEQDSNNAWVQELWDTVSNNYSV